MPSVIAPQGCYLVALSRIVEEGETVEVDEETARSLIEQGWSAPEPEPAPASSPRRARQQPSEKIEE